MSYMLKRLNSMNPLKAVDYSFGRVVGRIGGTFMGLLGLFTLPIVFVPEETPFVYRIFDLCLSGFFILVGATVLVPCLRGVLKAVRGYISYRELGKLLEGEHFTEDIERTIYSSEHFILMNDTFVPRSLILGIEGIRTYRATRVCLLLSSGKKVFLRYAHERGVTEGLVLTKLLELSTHPDASLGPASYVSQEEVLRLKNETRKYLDTGNSFASLIGKE